MKEFKQITLLECFLYIFQGKISIGQLFRYLTTIAWLLLLLYPISKRIFDLHFLFLTILWITTWMIIVYPQKMFLVGADGTTTYYLTDFDMIFMHFIAHVIPFVVITYLESRQSQDSHRLTNKTLFTILFLLSYLLFADVRTLYGVKKDVIFVISCMVGLFIIALEA